ncbi:MAG: aminotransferase class V-fold PLP-dependent enzyme [Ectothiorhodospiraceae bacterium]|nr:aminotransferase class V-fold PLP-dependent enzyme [Ectothiorhodospiraceae bacterium]
MDSKEFRQLGLMVVNELADYLEDTSELPITVASTNQQIKSCLKDHALQDNSKAIEDVLSTSINFLRENSFNSNHPRQWGYILPTVDPVSSLAELIVGVFNQNLAGWEISPAATEIENQTVQWLAEIIGFGKACDGIFVSGGNVANFTAILCAKQYKLKSSRVRQLYEKRNCSIFSIYASTETHTWIDKFIKVFGFSQCNLRLIPCDNECQIKIPDLETTIAIDLSNGLVPLTIIATAGTTSTGAIDPIVRLSNVAKKHDIWLHVDGAYGALAACLESSGDDLKSLGMADSVAIDPHKWLYTSYEAGCVLVKDCAILQETFSADEVFISDPKYYQEEVVPGEKNYLLYGLQNSRGFRALKVWLQLQYLGKIGLKRRLQRDVDNAEYLYKKSVSNPDLEAWTLNLSVVTFRYVSSESSHYCAEINLINKNILNKINTSGEAYLSFTEISNNYLLRACFVNSKTKEKDIDSVLDLIVKIGDKLCQ